MSKSKLLSTVYQAAEGRRQCNMALRNKLAKNNEIDGISNLEDIALKIIISNAIIRILIKLFLIFEVLQKLPKYF